MLRAINGHDSGHVSPSALNGRGREHLTSFFRRFNFRGWPMKVSEHEDFDIFTLYMNSGRIRLIYRWGLNPQRADAMRAQWLKAPTPAQEMQLRLKQ